MLAHDSIDNAFIWYGKLIKKKNLSSNISSAVSQTKGSIPILMRRAYQKPAWLQQPVLHVWLSSIALHLILSSYSEVLISALHAENIVELCKNMQIMCYGRRSAIDCLITRLMALGFKLRTMKKYVKSLRKVTQWVTFRSIDLCFYYAGVWKRVPIAEFEDNLLRPCFP